MGSGASAASVGPLWISRALMILGLPLAAFCVYFAAVHALILIGQYSDIDATEGKLVRNQWLDMAEPMAGWIPDLYEAQGQYYLDLGVKLTGESRAEAMTLSAAYWDGAYDLRPGWPYYPLSALVAESYFDAPADRVQLHMDQMMAMSFNERGIHIRLFDTSFRLWGKLTRPQQDWVLAQAAMPYGATTRRAFHAAKQYGFKPLLCARLPWNVAKKYCSK